MTSPLHLFVCFVVNEDDFLQFTLPHAKRNPFWCSEKYWKLKFKIKSCFKGRRRYRYPYLFGELFALLLYNECTRIWATGQGQFLTTRMRTSMPLGRWENHCPVDRLMPLLRTFPWRQKSGVKRNENMFIMEPGLSLHYDKLLFLPLYEGIGCFLNT